MLDMSVYLWFPFGTAIWDIHLRYGFTSGMSIRDMDIDLGYLSESGISYTGVPTGCARLPETSRLFGCSVPMTTNPNLELLIIDVNLTQARG